MLHATRIFNGVQYKYEYKYKHRRRRTQTNKIQMRTRHKYKAITYTWEIKNVAISAKELPRVLWLSRWLWWHDQCEWVWRDSEDYRARTKNRIESRRVELSRKNFKFRLKCLARSNNTQVMQTVKSFGLGCCLCFTSYLLLHLPQLHLVSGLFAFQFRAVAENGNKSCPKWAHRVLSSLASFSGASSALHFPSPSSPLWGTYCVCVCSTCMN